MSEDQFRSLCSAEGARFLPELRHLASNPNLAAYQ